MTSRSFISEDEVQRALDYLRDHAGEAAQARANRVYVEEFRKVVKASIMREHQLLPRGAQEREAYSDPRYAEHLRAIRDAVQIDEKHRFLMESAKAKLDCWRTQQATERAHKL
jgi:hypothetical protein